MDAAGGDKIAPKGTRLTSSALVLAVIILVYQKHVPEPIGVLWIKDTLDYVLWALGAVLLGQLMRQCGTGVLGFYRRLQEGVSIKAVIRVGADREKNERGS